jgi:3-oxoacyl-[acyl-carrier-protein] synthase II
MNKRVVITGVGLVSGLGESAALLHQKLCAGICGLGEITEYENQGFDSRPGGSISSFTPEMHLKGKTLRPLDRTGKLFASAAKLALESSGWTAEYLAAHDVGVVLGTMFGSMHTISQFDRQALMDGPSCVSPMDFSNTVINSAAAQTAIWHKLRGINSTTASGATSGLMAIGYATDLIQCGRQAAVLAGGADEFCFEAFCGMDRAGLLSGPPSKHGCAIPFDQRRTGMALSEAAAVLALEDWESAQDRGAAVLGEIRGHANAYNPAWTQNRRSPEAISRAMQGALDNARLSAAEVDCISAAANGSVAEDKTEALAISAVFNGHTNRVSLTAIKSMLGETLGAAGILQSIDFLETVRTSVLPGIAGLAQVDQELASLDFCRQPKFLNARVALINGVGFDGHACSLIITAPPQA